MARKRRIIALAAILSPQALCLQIQSQRPSLRRQQSPVRYHHQGSTQLKQQRPQSWGRTAVRRSRNPLFLSSTSDDAQESASCQLYYDQSEEGWSEDISGDPSKVEEVWVQCFSQIDVNDENYISLETFQERVAKSAEVKGNKNALFAAASAATAAMAKAAQEAAAKVTTATTTAQATSEDTESSGRQTAEVAAAAAAVAAATTTAEVSRKSEEQEVAVSSPVVTAAVVTAAAAAAAAGRDQGGVQAGMNEESSIGKPFVGVWQDIKRRAPVYRSDWKDGFKPKTIGAVLLMYVACLAPTVSFGGLVSSLTGGNMGVVEFLVSHGVSGMIYSVICGQPMAFIAPTGLTMAFTAALYRFTGLAGLPFLETYGWVGLWTSGMLLSLASGGFAQLIKFCTSFTDDVFNALLALNFSVEAMQALLLGFSVAGPDKTAPFLALNFALFTCFASLKVSDTRRSKLFNKSTREAISDFGPVAIIVAVSLLSSLPVFQTLGVEFLKVPLGRHLAGGRGLLLGLGSVPNWARWAAALPGALLTMLFYLDHLITVRVVNNPRHRLKKGAAFNQDLFALGLIVALQSVCGLPWMCGATVQSLNHIRAMATYGEKEEEGGDDGGAAAAAADAAAAAAAAAGGGGGGAAAGDVGAENNNSGVGVGEAGRDSKTGEGGVVALSRVQQQQQQQQPSRAKRLLTKAGRASFAMAAAFAEAWSEDDDDHEHSLSSSSSLHKAASTATAAEPFIPRVSSDEDGDGPQITSVLETRLSGLVLHSMILSSVALLPLLRFIPMPVIYGVFLFLGRKVMSGNAFIARSQTILYDSTKLPPSSAIKLVGRKTVARYIGIQGACLAMLWSLKSFKPTAIFFPSVIGGLVVLRKYVLPNVFKPEELEVLDSSDF